MTEPRNSILRELLTEDEYLTDGSDEVILPYHKVTGEDQPGPSVDLPLVLDISDGSDIEDVLSNDSDDSFSEEEVKSGDEDGDDNEKDDGDCFPSTYSSSGTGDDCDPDTDEDEHSTPRRRGRPREPAVAPSPRGDQSPEHPVALELRGSQPHAPSAAPLWARVYPPEEPKCVEKKFKVRAPGPRQTDGCSTPLDFFMLFMPDAVWSLMVRGTNGFASRHIDALRAAGRVCPNSRVLSWGDVSVQEMKKFWALMINMGVVKKNTIQDYWSTLPNMYTPFFSKTMPLRRFQQILSMLSVSTCVSPSKGQPGYDPWVKVRQFIDLLNSSFREHFTPNQKVCIDGSTIAVKNRCALIQYKANMRHSRFGIKKFDLSDSATGYVLQSALYSGRDILAMGAEPITQRVVTDLMSKVDLYSKRYHLFTNNFHADVPLANFLLARKTYLTGTINNTSKFVSKLGEQADNTVRGPSYFRKSEVLLIKHKERSTRPPVVLISTAHHAEDKLVVGRSSNVQVTPVVAASHSQHTGRGDCKDRSTYHVTCLRQTRCYWKKIVYNFVDMALLNSYVLYRHQFNGRVTRGEFINDIINCLVQEPGPQGEVPQPPNMTDPEHKLASLGRNRRLCSVCNLKSSFWCPPCNTGVHQKCLFQHQHFPLLTNTGSKRRRAPSTDSED